MNEAALAKELKLEMIPDGLYREIAESIGIDNLVKLAGLIGGATFYLPKPESLIRPARDARIKQEFNGYNHLELAKRYNVTVRWVRTLCGDGHIPGQLSLIDYFDE